MNRCIALLACLALVAALVRPAAADDTGSITITITDASTHAPLGLARVLLDGPVIASELSGSDGKVSFVDVPDGIYRARVFKSSYDPATSAQFEVLTGRSITLDVALAKPAVKSLGTITVTSAPAISSTNVGDTSAVRKLSDTLSDALGKLSGVSISTDPNGASDSQVTISLEGHDPSQTALTLDGIPLNAPGVAGDLRSINTDLFSSANANFGPSAGSLGGSVGFRSLEPTLTWQGKFTTSLGTYSKAATVVQASGTTGRLGIAFTASIRGSQSPLADQTFLDSSGLDYTHAGATQNGGLLFKLRTSLGSAQTLSGTFAATNNYDDLVCARFTGPVPCGYGPGNFSTRHFALASLQDTALAGLVGLQFSLFGTGTTYDRDLLDRFVAGVPAPFGTISDSQTRGASVNATLPSHERHTFSIQATTTHARFDSLPLSSSNSLFALASSVSSFSTVSISDKIHSSNTLTLGARIGYSFSPQTSNAAIGGASASWAPTSADTYSGSLDFGGAGAGFSRSVPLTDPSSLRFDCNSGLGYGSGPGDQPGPTSSVSARLSWQHRLRAGQITATLYRQVQNDVLLNALVNGSVLPPGYFPPGYFPTAQAVYQSTAGCGGASAFGPANLYLSIPVGATQRMYQGAQFTGGFRIGQNLVAEPYYNITEVVASSGSPFINNAFSLVVPGAQAPNQPLHRGGLTLDYKARHSAVEGLLNSTFVSGNNANNLPGYVTADAGVAITLTRGTLTLAETNIFNKFGYDFASSANSVPLETAGGSVIPTVARPLSPRQFSVTYSVKLGNVPQGNYTPSLLADNGTRPAGGLAFGPGPGGPGGGLASLPALTATPTAHPLDPDSSRQACTPDAAKQVRPLLDQIKAYVAAVDAAKVGDSYPASAPPDAPVIDGVNVAYHKTDTSYALTFTQTKFGSIRSFIQCAPVHIGTTDQAKALGLFIPPTSAFSRFPLVYSPQGGLYVVRQPPTPGQEQFRLYRLPAGAPAAPFAVVGGAQCTAELKPTAVSLLGELQSYFVGFDPNAPESKPPAAWTITTHKTANGFWSELLLNDISRLPAILYCARVSTGSPDEIKARQLDGVRPPTLNYSPSLGIYLVRPTPPPNPQQ